MSDAFHGDTMLETVQGIGGTNLETLEAFTFYNTGITTFTVPATIKTIQEGAFSLYLPCTFPVPSLYLPCTGGRLLALPQPREPHLRRGLRPRDDREARLLVLQRGAHGGAY